MNNGGFETVALLPAVLVYELTPRAWWSRVPEGAGLIAAGVFSGLCWAAVLRSLRAEARHNGRL